MERISVQLDSGESRIRYQKLSRRSQQVDVDVVHSIRAVGALSENLSAIPSTGSKGCFFQDELERNKELCAFSSYKRFYYTRVSEPATTPQLSL